MDLDLFTLNLYNLIAIIILKIPAHIKEAPVQKTRLITPKTGLANINIANKMSTIPPAKSHPHSLNLLDLNSIALEIAAIPLKRSHKPIMTGKIIIVSNGYKNKYPPIEKSISPLNIIQPQLSIALKLRSENVISKIPVVRIQMDSTTLIER